VLSSVLLSAVFTVAQARLLPGRDPIAVTAVQFLGAAFGALAFTVITEGGPALPAGAGPVLAVGALAAAGTLLPYTLFAYGQTRIPAEVAGAFLNLEPVVGTTAGALIFGDPMGPAQVTGGAAILAGIGLSSLPLVAGGQGRSSPVADREATGVPAQIARMRGIALAGVCRANDLGQTRSSPPEQVGQVCAAVLELAAGDRGVDGGHEAAVASSRSARWSAQAYSPAGRSR
jgi:hypothetical protein